MGAEPDVTVGPGAAVSMPTGGVLPPGADAVVMIEYTQQVMPGTVEVVRPVAPGEGVVRADEDAAAGGRTRPGGPAAARPGPGHAGRGRRHHGDRARPAAGDHLLHRRRGGAAGDGDAAPGPGQGRDRGRAGRPGRPRRAASPRCPASSPTTAQALEAALRGALPASDLIVISAGSSVGTRGRDRGRGGRARRAGIWCHGIAVKPGKPTLLAECDGVPVIGLPGNPRSALVVFRLIGVPLVRLAGGCTAPPPEPAVRARLARDLASAAGRLDVVQVTVADGVATPVFGLSALLSVLTAADGYVIVPEEATGLDAGTEVDVTLYR